jgi:hypothetical protein
MSATPSPSTEIAADLADPFTCVAQMLGAGQSHLLLGLLAGNVALACRLSAVSGRG